MKSLTAPEAFTVYIALREAGEKALEQWKRNEISETVYRAIEQHELEARHEWQEARKQLYKAAAE